MHYVPTVWPDTGDELTHIIERGMCEISQGSDFDGICYDLG
jgi:hypothetical protein